MSRPYTIATPVNLFSSSANASIRLFNGGTFSTTLQAPTLTSTNPFIFPSNTGTANQALQYTLTGTQWAPPPASATLNTPSGPAQITGFNSKNVPVSIRTNGTTAINAASTTSTTFVRIGLFRFRGTSVDGTPTSIRAVIGGVVTTGTVSVRIVNFTNAVTIGTSTGVITSATPQLVTIPITNPFPVNQAIMEFQLSVVGGGTAQLWHIHVIF